MVLFSVSSNQIALVIPLHISYLYFKWMHTLKIMEICEMLLLHIYFQVFFYSYIKKIHMNIKHWQQYKTDLSIYHIPCSMKIKCYGKIIIIVILITILIPITAHCCLQKNVQSRYFFMLPVKQKPFYAQ